MTDKRVADWAEGALLGLACGDAVGTTVEFKRQGSFPAATDMAGGGPFGLRPGQWTDDTSMALCLAESLLVCRGFDARDQAERYVRPDRRRALRCRRHPRALAGAAAYAGEDRQHGGGAGRGLTRQPVGQYGAGDGRCVHAT